MTATKILPCTCPHSYQDSLYGSGRRVCNPLPKPDKSDQQKYRCSVCRAEHQAEQAQK